MSFQTTVNAVPAPGIAGDFASTNPRHNAMGGPGGFVAGSAGVACAMGVLPMYSRSSEIFPSTTETLGRPSAIAHFVRSRFVPLMLSANVVTV